VTVRFLILFCSPCSLSIKEKKAEIGISLVVYKAQTFFEMIECFKLASPESRALCTADLLEGAKLE
jgi:hypothetical protein